jgi:hypothetical protein
MRRHPLRVVICGILAGPESRFVEAELARLPADAEIRREPGTPANWPQVAGEADLCIVLQGWPDEIPNATAQAVVAACVAGRLICCQGAWCASAGRTRRTWPPAVCTPVEQFGVRLGFELAVLRDECDPLPVTASLDEIFAALYSNDAGAAQRTGIRH